MAPQLPTEPLGIKIQRQLGFLKGEDWGEIEGHIDDEHGHIADEADLSKREGGCGFLKVWHDVLGDVYQLFGVDGSLPGLVSQSEVEDIPGSQFIADIRTTGGTVLPLTGNHKTIGATETPV